MLIYLLLKVPLVLEKALFQRNLLRKLASVTSILVTLPRKTIFMMVMMRAMLVQFWMKIR